MKSHKLWLFGVFITIVIVSVTATAVVMWRAFSDYEKQRDRQAIERLSQMATIAFTPVFDKQRKTNELSNATLQRFAEREKLLAIALLDQSGQPFETFQRSDMDAEALDRYQHTLSDKRASEIRQTDTLTTTMVRVGSRDYPKGFIALAVKRDNRLFKPLHLWSMVLLPLAFILLVMLLLGYVAIHRLVKPISHLNQFMDEVNDTKNYALRLLEPQTKEFKLLCRRINTLLATIEVELSINSEQNQTLVEQQQTMTRLANFDSLTGLPNRQFIMDNLRLELNNARDSGQDVALLFFDLDGFKGINDSLGHETGDLILIDVADRVSGLLRSGDLVARLGGDEFVVLPDGETNDAVLQNLASRLISAFDEPFSIRGLSLQVGVGIGIAKASDADYDLSKLMSNANLAMYRSKDQGRGRFTVFTPDMVQAYKRKLAIASSIDTALNNNEFIVFYQPKVSRVGDIVGVEALIRWQHPTMGMIMPDEFIEVAEQGGKISRVTRYVIERVCQNLPQIRQWAGDKVRVAINLSAHDLRDNRLFDFIHQTFHESDVNPERIEFEVTESAYLDNFALSNTFFKRLSNMGCFISLDDFGTGYSSLSYLTQISIDALKVDRQFVKDLDSSERNRTVTGAIIDLAKRLSLFVCAEGVEHQYQWDYLIAQGCDEVQGYMFSQPVALERLLLMPNHFRVENNSSAHGGLK